MRFAVACLAVAVALMSGCSSERGLGAVAILPATVRNSPQRFVVVTVQNPVKLPAIGAASTPRGYDGIGVYAAGSVARAASRAIASDYRLRQVAGWPIELLGVHCLVYELSPDSDLTTVLARLHQDPRVESAQELHSFGTQTQRYNDPYSPLQQNVNQMDVVQAHALSRGANVRVAVIDTGAAVDHPDLPANVVVRNFVDADRQAFREDAHGTAIAGVIAAVPDNGVGIVGIAPDARLLLYKACWAIALTGTQAACNSFTLAQALAGAIEAHADIINLSLAGPSDPLLTRLVDRAVDAGIILVGAVPPDGSRDAFPTNIDAVIAVDAMESGHRASHVIRAPGEDVISLSPEGHYDFYSGSSLATAEVSGLIALLRSKRPQLTAREAETLLIESEPVNSDRSQRGAPNVCIALQSLLKALPCSSR